MTNERYAKLIMYKAALDNAWKKIDPVSLYNDEYSKTLAETKLAGFKVMRNSKGDHKLIDDVGEAAWMYEKIAEVYRGR